MTGLDRLRLAVRLLFSRGVQIRSRYNADNARILQTQVRADGGPLNLEHLEPFGFTGHAPDGSETLVLSFSGKRSHSVVLLAHNREYKLQIAPGECAIYNQWGDFVRLQEDGNARIQSRLKVQLNTPEVEVMQTLTVHGPAQFDDAVNMDTTLTVGVDAEIGGISFIGHTHLYIPGAGSPTSSDTPA